MKIALQKNSVGACRQVWCSLNARTVALRTFACLMIGPQFASDSARYAGNFLDFKSIDFSGRRGSPAPLVSLLWHLPSWLALILQAGLASCAWVYLANAVSRTSNFYNRSKVLFLFVTCVSFLPPALSIDTLALTESISTSAYVALLGATVNLLSQRRISEKWLIHIPVMAIIASALSRPGNIVLWAPIAIVIALRVTNQFRWVRPTFVLVCLAFAALSLVYIANAGNSPQAKFRAENRFALRANASLINAAIKLGLPSCAAADSIRFVTLAQLNPAEAVTLVRRHPCKEFHQWLVKHGKSPYRLQFAAFRSTIAQYVRDIPAQQFLVFGLGEEYTIGKFFSSKPIARYGLAMLVPLANLLAALYFVLKLFAGLRTRKGFPPAYLCIVSSVIGVSWIFFSFLTWLEDSFEVARHYLPVQLAVGPSLIALGELFFRAQAGAAEI